MSIFYWDYNILVIDRALRKSSKPEQVSSLQHVVDHSIQIIVWPFYYSLIYKISRALPGFDFIAVFEPVNNVRFLLFEDPFPIIYRYVRELPIF